MIQRRLVTRSNAGSGYADRIKKVDALFRIYRDALARRRETATAGQPRAGHGAATTAFTLPSSSPTDKRNAPA